MTDITDKIARKHIRFLKAWGFWFGSLSLCAVLVAGIFYGVILLSEWMTGAQDQAWFLLASVALAASTALMAWDETR